jgi:hypothetical protein
MFKWVWSFKTGKKTEQKGICPSHPATLRTTAPVRAISYFIMADRHIPSDETQCKTGLIRATLHINHHLQRFGMKKVCTPWVPQDLTQQKKQRGVDTCHQLLARHNEDIEDFFRRLSHRQQTLAALSHTQQVETGSAVENLESPWPKKILNCSFYGQANGHNFLGLKWEYC